MSNEVKSKCKWCDDAELKPKMLDENGTLCSITGKPGTLCHAYEDSWWPCENGVEFFVAAFYQDRRK